MTTLEESIVLMDWLREHREIGFGCETDDGRYGHLPEYRREEARDYSDWEQELRSAEPVGERNYGLIRRAAQKAWEEKHGEHWTNGDTITQRTTELVQLSHLRERVRR